MEDLGAMLHSLSAEPLSWAVKELGHHRKDLVSNGTCPACHSSRTVGTWPVCPIILYVLI